MTKNFNIKQDLRKIRGAYLISVISITMVLFIVGIVSLLVINSNSMSNTAKESIGFTIYLKNEIKPVETDRLKHAVEVAEYTKSIEFISQDKAAVIMKEELGKDFTKALGYNSLPASIDVKLKYEYANKDSVAVIREKLSKFKNIKEIFYQKSLVSLVNENIRKMTIAGLIIAILLLVISTSLINNTIALSLYSKRFMIRTAQLIGATQNFIRKPFIIKNIISGILSASFASLFLVFLMLFLQRNFENFIIIKGVWISVLTIFLFGIVITGISSYFFINKYLKADSNSIYFEN